MKKQTAWVAWKGWKGNIDMEIVVKIGTYLSHYNHM
jgi:hypothetical protein